MSGTNFDRDRILFSRSKADSVGYQMFSCAVETGQTYSVTYLVQVLLPRGNLI